MKANTIIEGEAKIKIFEPEKDKDVSKDLEVFYNPVMKLNRDLTILLLNSIDNNELQIADPLAGSGVRSVRLLSELKEGKVKNIKINDMNPNAIKLIKENISLNEKNLICDDIEVSQLDANLFLEESFGFDYIDIDPFGSPNFLLDSSIKRMSRKGILAVTATDTSALSGTYPKTGLRKYWAKTVKNEHKHEIGIRVLIRKCQLIGAQYERALTPILSYSHKHYFRIFFRVEKGKQKVDEIIKKHEYYHYCNVCANHKITSKNHELCCDKEMSIAGPLWNSNLHDTKMVKRMLNENKYEENNKLLNKFYSESKINSLFFYDIHTICKKHKLRIPRKEGLIKTLIDKGFKVSNTHFLDTAIKSDISFKELLKIIRK